MKELKLTTQEAVNYLKENVKIHDDIEISYNRIFAEGEVLNMDFSEYFGEPGFKMLVSLDQSQLGSTVEIDIYELQDDIKELDNPNSQVNAAENPREDSLPIQ